MAAQGERIAILADAHANLAALRAILADGRGSGLHTSHRGWRHHRSALLSALPQQHWLDAATLVTHGSPRHIPRDLLGHEFSRFD